MLTVKYYSSKSNAKRALAKMGEHALAAADKLLVEGGDGQWGFCAGQAAQVEADAKKPQPAAKVEQDKADPVGYVCPKCGEKHLHGWVNYGVSLWCKACGIVFSIHGNVIRNPVIRKTHNAGYKIQESRETRNGITRPSEGTTTAAIWAILDVLAKAGPIDSKEAKAIVVSAGYNPTTFACQYLNWRRFYK